MKTKYLKKLRRQAETTYEVRDYGVPKSAGKVRYVLYDRESDAFVCNGNSLEYIKDMLKGCKDYYIMKELEKLRRRYNKPRKHREYKIISFDR